MKWTEQSIARALARQTFDRKHLVIVPNCSWPGSECDLLVVTTDLRVIDVEIKISRSDLKADAKKDKWWRHGFGSWDPVACQYSYPDAKALEWPRRVWKHYYAVPRDVWDDALFMALPSRQSGVILLTDNTSGWPQPPLICRVARKATPCKTADRLTPAQAVDVARLASLRMWESYERLEALQASATKPGLTPAPATEDEPL